MKAPEKEDHLVRLTDAERREQLCMRLPPKFSDIDPIRDDKAASFNAERAITIDFIRRQSDQTARATHDGLLDQFDIKSLFQSTIFKAARMEYTVLTIKQRLTGRYREATRNHRRVNKRHLSVDDIDGREKLAYGSGQRRRIQKAGGLRKIFRPPKISPHQILMPKIPNFHTVNEHRLIDRNVQIFIEIVVRREYRHPMSARSHSLRGCRRGSDRPSDPVGWLVTLRYVKNVH